MTTTELELNAWTDGRVFGKLDRVAKWSLRSTVESPPTFLFPKPLADPWDWKDPRVGWGLILRDGAPLSAPVQYLRNHRQYGGRPAPLFRYKANSNDAFVRLRNYDAGKDININGAPMGTAVDALPQFLLICGSPEAVPWRLQYILNANRCVGRLDLDGPELANYIGTLLKNWEGAAARSDAAVVWAVVNNPEDITGLMRTSIAAKVAASLGGDSDIAPNMQFIDGLGASASGAKLSQAIRMRNPGLIVTTSHGKTGPVEDIPAMARTLGMLVDQDHDTIEPKQLLEGWEPDGAIWYAHACCSAGADANTNFSDLFSGATRARQVLDAVAKVGSTVAPLPRALLGAKRPLRAFIGHVEPTFDLTLRDKGTGQFLTSNLTDALYSRLYQPYPVGFAFRNWYARIGGLTEAFESSKAKFGSGEGTVDLLLSLQLARRDIQSTVILGDPTVTVRGSQP
jgi:hypothetical protein